MITRGITPERTHSGFKAGFRFLKPVASFIKSWSIPFANIRIFWDSIYFIS